MFTPSFQVKWCAPSARLFAGLNVMREVSAVTDNANPTGQSERVAGAIPERRNALYMGLSRAELIERLNAAEDACIVFGWTASRMDSARDKAAHELWRAWLDLVGDGFISPKQQPHLNDDLIDSLARKRDATRARTLAAIDAMSEPAPVGAPDV